MKFSFVLAIVAVAEAAKVKKAAKAGLTKDLLQQKKQALQTRSESADGDCYDYDILDHEVDSYGDGCEWYYDSESSCGAFDTAYFIADELCCACGGGI